APSQAPPSSDLSATSLALLTGRAVDLELLLSVMLEDLDRRVADLHLPGGPGIQMEEYRSRSATLGRQVRVEEIGGTTSGRAAAIADDGRLILETATGRREVTTADVVHLRNDERYQE
ncbi:MAG: hypothetical protein WAM97_10075, partial [Acidimicrobiales bacterium]